MKLRILQLCFFFSNVVLAISLRSFPIRHENLIKSSGEEDDELAIKTSDFPPGFLFGVATSAYQVEGAYLEDGKSISNWDYFCASKGCGTNGENGDVAVDHYHHYLRDIEMMHSLGVKAYRLSISWARVLPRGKFGKVNPKGIDFYNRIIDNLLLKGIEPFVTIHHHDFPQVLEQRFGSWLSPLMQDEFIHFAKTCFESFGDRVKYWMTINEPNLFAQMAYEKGWYPPARCSQPFGNCSAGNSDVEPLIAMHNMLLAHGKAVKLYRQDFQPMQGGSVGIVGSCFMYEPLTDDDLGRKAAKRGMAFDVGWTFDPVIFGDYPPEMRLYHGSELPQFSPEEKNFMKNSVDFIGVNHYSAIYAKDCTHSNCADGGDRAIQGYITITGERNGVPIGEPTAMPVFYVVPRGMEEIVDYIKNRYNNTPMIVTENGYSTPMQQNAVVEDLLEDVDRVKFLKSYISSLSKAIRNGADVRGYFVWSLMDSYEWTFGYDMRFGLYYVDRHTQTRIPKLSAKWYKSFLTNTTLNGQEEPTTRPISSI